MTKSFIKKIFSFNKFKEQEMEQISIPDKSDIIEKKKDKNERTKNNEISIDTEKEEQTKNKKSTPTKCDEKSPPLESHSDKASLSVKIPPYGKIIVTNTIREKKDEEILSESFVEQKKTAWFGRLKKGLSLSSQRLSGSISDLFVKRKLDEATLQELEDILIQADLGVETATRITNTLASSRYGKDLSPDDIHTIVADEIKKVLEPVAIPLELDLSHKPHVILLVGVNGTGKTTTIGKLAAKLTAGGLKVMLAAGDTFRAAAIEQLHIWGERTDSPVISTKLGADAASLAFDAFEKAKKANSDVLIIDTAGRLQNKSELMDELAKIIRVLRKHTPQAPHTILQTLDATTGQNALNQVDIFRDIAGVNGLVMTKLDGTARGGILVAIAAKYKLPVYFIGIGENIEDLQPFSASDFAETIAGKHV
ncbi:signal recognition particle-docking protein FtsY [Bartonella sp. AC535YNZD]|uniref:signal recognition particle-docking protein FtsY n=2 Tax=Bartonella TaxID=773 RepID=UPI0035CFECDA